MLYIYINMKLQKERTMHNPIYNNGGNFIIDQIQLRENLMEIFVLFPTSISKLAKEVGICAPTLRKFIKGSDIQPETAFKLTNYINKVMAN